MGVELIQLTQKWVEWRVLLNTSMDPWFHKIVTFLDRPNDYHLESSFHTGEYLDRTLLDYDAGESQW
jgi:hypothetical protein